VRLGLKGANPAEWLALRTGLVPTAAAEAWGGMATSGVLIAAVRTGITARLAQGNASADKVAADLGLDPRPTRLLLDCLRSAGHVRERAGRYRLSRSARRWLDPASPLSVACYVAGTADYWPWWAGLDETVRTGTSSGSHGAASDDAYWLSADDEKNLGYKSQWFIQFLTAKCAWDDKIEREAYAGKRSIDDLKQINMDLTTYTSQLRYRFPANLHEALARAQSE